MSTIVTRSGKGSPLTHVEVDANFTNLNTDKIQSGNTVAALTITSATINGGAVNATTIGATTASTGAFSTLSATGVTTVQAGSVSAPAITTTGDTNTGIFFPAADTIAFTEGGVEAMRIDSSANVGIGLTSYTGKLAVNGVIATYASTDNNYRGSIDVESGNFRFTAPPYASNPTPITFCTGTSSTERMRIDTSGNVGIGTSSSGSKLDISGANAGSVLSSRILNTSTNASSDSQQFIYVNGASAGDAYTTWTVGGVQSWSSGVRNSDSDKWYLSAGSSLATTPAMVVDTSGNVGIGTSSPSQKLDVKGNQRLIGDSAYILWRNTADSASSGVIQFPSASAATIGTYVNQAMLFQTNDSERMRITSGGNLIIGGSTGAGGKLEVRDSYIRSFNGNSSQGTGYVASDGAGNEWHFGRNTDNGYYYVVRQTGTGMYMNTNSWVATSDIRAKENIAPLENSLSKVLSLNPVRFTFKKDGMADVGFIAQEMFEHIPDAVDKPEDENEMMGISKEKIIPFLVKAIQEQQALITNLTTRLNALEGK